MTTLETLALNQAFAEVLALWDRSHGETARQARRMVRRILFVHPELRAMLDSRHVEELREAA